MRRKLEETRDEFVGRLVRRAAVAEGNPEVLLARIRELATRPEEPPARNRARLRRLGRPIAVLALVTLAAGLVGGFVGARTAGSAASAAPPMLAFEVAPGWNTLQTRLPLPAGDKVQIAWASNVPFAGNDVATGFPLDTARILAEDGIVVYASSSADVDNPDEYRNLTLPLSLSDGRFVADGYQNQPAPHVSMVTIGARLESTYVLVHAYFGSNKPTAAAWAAAEAELRRLRVPN